MTGTAASHPFRTLCLTRLLGEVFVKVISHLITLHNEFRRTLKNHREV